MSYAPDTTEKLVDCYQDAFEYVYQWVKDGHFDFKGSATIAKYCDLDDLILKIFGFSHEPNRLVMTGLGPSNDLAYLGAIEFDNALDEGKLNIDWLVSPHGLTLFKLKMIQAGV